MKKLLSIFIISLLLFNVYAQGEDSVELAKEYNERDSIIKRKTK